MARKILIFDIDKTISNDCFHNADNIKQNVQDIIRKANKHGHLIYIVTSRMNIHPAKMNDDNILSNVYSSDVNIIWKYAISDNVDKDIIALIKKNVYHIHNVNPNKPGNWFKWIVREEVDRVNRFADFMLTVENSKNSHMKSMIHNYIKHENTTGAIKMLQIADIMDDNPGVSPSNIFFFDDALHNYEALKMWRTHIDSRFNRLNFLGGAGIPVFNTYPRYHLERLDLID
jgi:hydroxymethylpyrimidine pyrophosphatase-like HAD family hydrolase